MVCQGGLDTESVGTKSRGGVVRQGLYQVGQLNQLYDNVLRMEDVAWQERR